MAKITNEDNDRDLIDVTGGWLGGLRDWIDERFPMTEFPRTSTSGISSAPSPS